MSEDSKTDRYEMPKRIDRLEKHNRELVKKVNALEAKLEEAFQLLHENTKSTFGLGGLAAVFKGLAEGFKRG